MIHVYPVDARRLARICIHVGTLADRAELRDLGQGLLATLGAPPPADEASFMACLSYALTISNLAVAAQTRLIDAAETGCWRAGLVAFELRPLGEPTYGDVATYSVLPSVARWN
jgi:hypothetical protein